MTLEKINVDRDSSRLYSKGIHIPNHKGEPKMTQSEFEKIKARFDAIPKAEAVEAELLKSSPRFKLLHDMRNQIEISKNIRDTCMISQDINLMESHLVQLEHIVVAFKEQIERMKRK